MSINANNNNINLHYIDIQQYTLLENETLPLEQDMNEESQLPAEQGRLKGGSHGDFSEAMKNHPDSCPSCILL